MKKKEKWMKGRINNVLGKKWKQIIIRIFQASGIVYQRNQSCSWQIGKTNFPQPNATVRPWCRTKPYKWSITYQKFQKYDKASVPDAKLAQTNFTNSIFFTSQGCDLEEKMGKYIRNIEDIGEVSKKKPVFNTPVDYVVTSI